MTARTLDVAMSPIVRGVVVNIRLTGMRAFAWRMTLGAKIMGLAVWVIGAKAKIEVVTEARHPDRI